MRGRCWVRWNVGGEFGWGYRRRGEVRWGEGGEGQGGCGVWREGKNEVD